MSRGLYKSTEKGVCSLQFTEENADSKVWGLPHAAAGGAEQTATGLWTFLLGRLSCIPFSCPATDRRHRAKITTCKHTFVPKTTGTVK